MTISRRFFIKCCGFATAGLSAEDFLGWAGAQAERAAPSIEATRTSDRLKELADVALNTARMRGASYSDIRINRYRSQNVSVRSLSEFQTGKLNHVPSVSDSESFGFGVRVIVQGTWGFAASNLVTQEEIRRAVLDAIEIGRVNSVVRKRPVQLAPSPAYRDRWTTPFAKSPFDVPIQEKLDFLLSVNEEVKKVPRVFAAVSFLSFRTEEKFFASTEGSYIDQLIMQTSPGMTAQARDLAAGTAKSRSYTISPRCAGYEYIGTLKMMENARRIGEEALEHLAAPSVTPGKRDLILLPSHLGLTIHESIGHSTELDRALGYEANFAGTSFVAPPERVMGKLRIGSDIVNFIGDRVLPGGMATCGFDDDGVKTGRWYIIKGGIFQTYQTIRDQAHMIGEKESRGCCYADSYDSVPFQRMPNVWLEPGRKPISLDDLVAGVDDGLLIDGRGSYSIDQQRYNFQFGGDAFWEIKGGKKRGMISNVAYQSRTTDFWSACDAICDERFWEHTGLNSDAKGQPQQLNAMSHGSAPARFRQINILRTE